MATLKQQRVVDILSESVRMNEFKSKGEILEKAQYADSSTKKPKRILESKGVQEELQPIINEMIEHREEILKQMKTKINKAHYNQLSDAFDKMTKNIQLLSGGSTENVININWEK